MRIYATNYKTIEARLYCIKIKLRNDIIAKVRKRYFWIANTLVFNTQFFSTIVALTIALNSLSTKSIEYNIFEQVEIIRLICNFDNSLSDRKKFRRKIQTIDVKATLYYRQEILRRDRLKFIVKQKKSKSAINNFEKDAKNHFLLVCRSIQYLFWLNNERLSYLYRIFEYFKFNRIINEIDKHLKSFVSEDPVSCLHLQCKSAGLVLPSAMVFKNYTATVHKIFLRA